MTVVDVRESGRGERLQTTVCSLCGARKGENYTRFCDHLAEEHTFEDLNLPGPRRRMDVEIVSEEDERPGLQCSDNGVSAPDCQQRGEGSGDDSGPVHIPSYEFVQPKYLVTRVGR